MEKRLGLVLLAALSMSACNEQNDANADMNSYQGRSFSVIGQLRPKADPNMIRQIHDEEEAARQARIAEYERQQKALQEQNNADSQRDLPKVDNSISSNLPPGTSTSYTNYNYTGGSPDANANQSWAMPVQPAPPPPPQAAGYGINYTQPSAGFVPPPPAVSLSTSAVPMPYGAPPDYNPYNNPYAYMQQQPTSPPSRKGGLFGDASSGARSASQSDDEEGSRKKKEKNFQIITPTGMEMRSPYKQRDELRILWKGALASVLSGLQSDSKFAEGLSKIDVSLPGEASKGSLSISQRQVDIIFKNNAVLDRKIVGTVRKVQSDLVQAYYRYLYAYNKFYLTQQQVAARKLELDCAESQAEKQRATVDLAQSQQEADASKDDMRAAQSDLAAVVGAQSARTVIKAVSGVSPSLEAIAQADPAQAQAGDGGAAGGFGGILNVFGIGKSKPKEENNAVSEDQVASSDDNGKEKKKDKKDKEKKKDKGDKKDKQQIASKTQDAVSSAATRADSIESQAQAQPQVSGPVSFELKDVKTTPRKSVLKVVVKNVGGDNFSFDADSISVAEGNSKLAEAAVRAEFDSTVVQPSQEVTGTITIFGRPWNDKLTVSLSDGTKPIILHR